MMIMMIMSLFLDGMNNRTAVLLVCHVEDEHASGRAHIYL